MFVLQFLTNFDSLQEWIQYFPGDQPESGVGGNANLLFGQNFPGNYMKMKKIERGGGGHVQKCTM